MKLTPLFDNVVLQPVESEEKTASGIILPSAAQEKQQIGVVVAKGPGELADGKEVKMQVKVGDKVLYGKYSGKEVKVDGKDLVVIKQAEILAIIS